MTQQTSFLAAIARAAKSSTSAAALAVAGNQESDMTTKTPAATTAETTGGPAASDQQITTVDALAAAYPGLVSSIRTEAATAERNRIIGIEAYALFGHEQLVATLKADGKTTPDQAAGQILLAERALHGKHLSGIKSVEDAVGTRVSAAPRAETQPGSSSSANTPDGWRAEFAASAKLQSEFADVADYVAYKANETHVRVLGGRKSA